MTTIREAQHKVVEFRDKVLPPDLTFSKQFGKFLEETAEFYKAHQKDHRVELVDGLGDTLYVLLGLANLSGVDLETAFDRIHESNMTKTRDGSLSPKGLGFKPPELT